MYTTTGEKLTWAEFDARVEKGEKIFIGEYPFEDVTHITVNGKVYDIIQAVAICLGKYYSKKTEKAKGFAMRTKNKIIVSKTIQSRTK